MVACTVAQSDHNVADRRRPTPFAARFPELAHLLERVEAFKQGHALGWRIGYERGRVDGAKQADDEWLDARAAPG